MKKYHVVKKILIEIEVNTKSKSHEMHNKMSRLSRDYFIPIMDRVFSEFSPTGTAYRIDKLEIDLGEIKTTSGKEELARTFKSKFREGVEKHFASNQASEPPVEESEKTKKPPFFGEGLGENLYPEEDFVFNEDFMEEENFFEERFYPISEIGSPTAKSKEEIGKEGGRDEDLVTYFLKTGLLPWWCDKDEPHFLEQAINRVLTESEKIHKLILSNEEVLKRVVFQFNDEQLEFLMGGLASFLGKVTTKFLGDVFQFLKEMERVGEISLKKFKLVLWQVALAEVLLDQTTLFSHLFQSWKKSPLFPLFSWKVLEVKNKKEKIDCSGSLLEIIASHIEEIEKTQTKDTTLEEEPKKKGPDLFPFIPKPGNRKFDDSENIFLSNGGLALIGQWIPDFFVEQGLIKEERFDSEEFLLKAVHLLQYLVTGKDEIQEYDLALNKLMCGIDLTEGIECVREINESEKKSCEMLLEKSIEFFPHLREMSIEDFQEVFLQRKAVLSVRDRCWLLRIESEGRDILLENFPWEYLKIDYPWMIDPIVIEWGLDY